ncbi:hypothetical protein STRIP9103_06706, partial [Streptomyces ipomoeae 91-03]
ATRVAGVLPASGGGGTPSGEGCFRTNLRHVHADNAGLWSFRKVSVKTLCNTASAVRAGRGEGPGSRGEAVNSPVRNASWRFARSCRLHDSEAAPSLRGCVRPPEVFAARFRSTSSSE